MAKLNLPNTFSDGTTADADEVNANFDEVVSGMYALGNQHHSADDPIDKDKIAHRGIAQSIVWTVLDWKTSHTTTANTFDSMGKQKIRVAPGERVSLVAVDIYAGARTQSGGQDPSVKVLKNAITIGNTAKTLTADNSFYEYANSDPWNNPFLEMQDEDTLEVQVGDESGNTPGLTGLIVTFHIRRELIRA